MTPVRRPDGRQHSRRLIGLHELHPEDAALLRRFRREQQRRGLADASIKTREQKYRLLAEEIYPRRLTEVDTETIQEFLDRRVLAPNTRYHYVSHLHVLYEWLLLEEVIDTDPTARIRRPKIRLGVPRPIGDDDLRDAVLAAEPQVAAMMALAAFQGLRAQEIAGLQREDILDTHDPPTLVVVMGKGGKQRVLPLHPEVMPALHRAGMQRAGHVLRQVSGRPMRSYTVSHAVNSHLRALGIEATIHQLRHWFGTKTYQASRDLRLVQGLLGHSSPTTTAVYAQYAVEGARPAVEGLSVRAVAGHG